MNSAGFLSVFLKVIVGDLLKLFIHGRIIFTDTLSGKEISPEVVFNFFLEVGISNPQVFILFDQGIFDHLHFHGFLITSIVFLDFFHRNFAFVILE